MLNLHIKRKQVDNLVDNSLALNESRAPYSPTLWWLHDDSTQKLRQVWFPGVHTSVGGGEKSYSISDITLVWMIQKILKHTKLECDTKYLVKGVEEGVFGENDINIPWGCGNWVKPTGILNFLGGTKERTPGRYPKSGPKTQEYYHKSVQERIKQGKYTGPDLSALTEEDSDDDLEQTLRW